jgi:hypothetical protein
MLTTLAFQTLIITHPDLITNNKVFASLISPIHFNGIHGSLGPGKYYEGLSCRVERLYEAPVNVNFIN